jgi:CRISPR-associated protein Csm5
MNKEQRFYIRMLSPVHLGCDEVYEPMGFVVDEQSSELVAFDPLAFFRTLSSDERNRFAAICRKGTIASLLELYQFFRGKKVDGLRVSVCRGFVDHYRTNLAMRPGDARRIQNELNKFSIQRTAFHANTGEPYIPGSAVKGALRTAYLNALAKVEKNVRYDDPARSKGAAQQLERGLLHYRDLQQDPFRMLKVSDFLPVTTRTTILYGVNEKKKPSKYDARGPYQILETVEPGSWFVGTISVEDGYARESGIVRPLTRDALFQSARLFYGREKAREEEELRSADLPPFAVNWGDGIPLRIGRHSGAESLTMKGTGRSRSCKARAGHRLPARLAQPPSGSPRMYRKAGMKADCVPLAGAPWGP